LPKSRHGKTSSRDPPDGRSFPQESGVWPVLAFCGAVIVALLSVGSNWYLDEQAEQRENRRTLDARNRAYEQAKRQVDDELQLIWRDFTMVLNEGTVPHRLPKDPPQEVFLPSTAWQQYKAVLATETTEQLWARIARVYGYVRGVRWDIVRQPRGKPFGSYRIKAMSAAKHDIEVIRASWPGSPIDEPPTCFPNCP
jgi:hypothetical protein